jgi:hypothetical protein
MTILIEIYNQNFFIVRGENSRYTINYKEELQQLGGKYNSNLTHKGKITPCWIFSNNSLEKVQYYINNLNNRMKTSNLSVLSSVKEYKVDYVTKYDIFHRNILNVTKKIQKERSRIKNLTLHLNSVNYMSLQEK